MKKLKVLFILLAVVILAFSGCASLDTSASSHKAVTAAPLDELTPTHAQILKIY